MPHAHRGALTITAAAEYLSVGEHEFKRLVKAGEIPLVTWMTDKGREMKRVRVRDLDAFLEKNLDPTARIPNAGRHP
jgi:excisionase family DNA binding protein